MELMLFFGVVLYFFIGINSWWRIECEEYDNYIYWKKGSFSVYFFFWPIIFLKFIYKTWKSLKHY